MFEREGTHLLAKTRALFKTIVQMQEKPMARNISPNEQCHTVAHWKRYGMCMLQHEEIYAGIDVPLFFGEEHVQIEGGDVVGNRININIQFPEENF